MNVEQMTAAMVRVEGMVDDIAEIKDSVKMLAQAVNRLAVIEERQSTDRAEIGRAYKRLDNHENRIRVIEQAQPMQKQTSDWVNKAVGMILSAVISAVLTLVVVKTTVPERNVPTLVAPK